MPRGVLGYHSPCGSDLSEVGLGDPRVPVVSQCGLGCRLALVLAEGPFVDDSFVAGPLEQARGDPRLRIC
jgi:hypothetical protein